MRAEFKGEAVVAATDALLVNAPTKSDDVAANNIRTSAEVAMLGFHVVLASRQLDR